MPVPTVPTPTGSLDVVAAARTNQDFRRVVATGRLEQVVVMTILPGGEIGEEVHPHTDQVFIVVEGRGVAVVGGQASAIGPDELLFVHAGSRHNVLCNEDGGPLRLITIYAPPEHAPGTVHRTKDEADRAEH